MGILHAIARLPLKAADGAINLLGYAFFGLPVLLVALAFLMANTWIFWLFGGMAAASLIIVGVALLSTASGQGDVGNGLPTTSAAEPSSSILGGSRRPTAGKALWAFTDRWLDENGLYDGKSIDKALATHIAGATAVRYHLAQGNFQERDGRMTLTADGRAHFLKRRKRL
jgi:hypothetical protein